MRRVPTSARRALAGGHLMVIVRTLPCTPDEFFSALERRFVSECADYGTTLGEVSLGAGYEDAELGVSVQIVAYERGSVLAWRACTPTDEVVSTFELKDDEGRCVVSFSREYPSGSPATGRLSEALLLGRMSNELMELGKSAASAREGSETLTKMEQIADTLSVRLARFVASKFSR